MYGALDPLQQQYGRLQCLSSVGLLFRIYICMVCVPPTASYGCGVIASFKLPLQPLMRPWQSPTYKFSGTSQVLGVQLQCQYLAELGLMCLPDQWLLRAATFWNALAALPPGSLCKQMALNAHWHACASSMSRAIRGTGYDLCIRQDDMHHIDIQVLSSHLSCRQRRDGV